MWARDRSRIQWWAGRESNPHSRRRLIYSQRSSPPAQPTHGCGGRRAEAAASWWNPPPEFLSLGADDGTRTRNRRFTKPLLYQLSYVGATRTGTPQRTHGRRRMIGPGGRTGQAPPAASSGAGSAGPPGRRSSSAECDWVAGASVADSAESVAGSAVAGAAGGAAEASG